MSSTSSTASWRIVALELQRQNELLAADYDLKAHLADQEAESACSYRMSTRRSRAR